MAEIFCNKLQIQRIDNDTRMIFFSRTYTYQNVTHHDIIEITFDEADKIVFKFNPGSSNGRIAVSETADRSSSLCPGAQRE